MLNEEKIKHLLFAHQQQVNWWMAADISVQVDLLNRAAKDEIDQGEYMDSVTEAHDLIMTMLHGSAWNGDSVDPAFWETEMGRTIEAVRFWIDCDELITISEAATLLRGGTTKADLMYIRRLIDRGKLTAYTDPAENNPTRSTRVSRTEVEKL